MKVTENITNQTQQRKYKKNYQNLIKASTQDFIHKFKNTQPQFKLLMINISRDISSNTILMMKSVLLICHYHKKHQMYGHQDNYIQVPALLQIYYRQQSHSTLFQICIALVTGKCQHSNVYPHEAA